MTNHKLNIVLGIILKNSKSIKLLDIQKYFNELEFDIEIVKLKYGLGFTHDKIYIDALAIYENEIQYGFDGHLLLYTILHEIGHMKRLKEDKTLLTNLDDCNLEEYLILTEEEEKFANDYALNTFKDITKIDVNDLIISSLPNIDDPRIKFFIETCFKRKESLGSWAKFNDDLIIKDYKYTSPEPYWNDEYCTDEKILRIFLDGGFISPFDLPKDAILVNAITYEASRVNGETIDDYNEKNKILICPFTGNYTAKVSYENGKLTKLYKIVDNEWISQKLK